MKAVVALLLAPLAVSQTWIMHPSGTTASLRGLSATSAGVVWASGTKGTVVVTTDGGASWQPSQVPDSEQLDFRDIQAVDSQTLYLLASGPGEKSRIYKTQDGGRGWALQFTNRDAKGFLDSLAFWDARHGIALGDPVDGGFVILRTDDAGAHWERRRGPTALPNEGAFAASGTSLVAMNRQECWFATGGPNAARVFHSTDRGDKWTPAATPVRSDGSTAGIFSLGFRDHRHGVAVGGDYSKATETAKNIAISSDGGRSWRPARGTPPSGYRSAVVFSRRSHAWVVVGPSGSDISTDGGDTWKKFDNAPLNTLSVAPDGSLWAAGPDGRIAELR